MKNTARLASRLGRVTPKSDTGNTKKRVPFQGLSEINYLCIAYVQTTNLGAKVANLCLAAKKMSKKRNRTYRGNQPIHAFS